MSKRTYIVVAGVLIAACGYGFSRNQDQRISTVQPLPAPENIGTAVFAGGCFWCMEPPFEKLHGVIDAESGYTGGHQENPTYEQVCRKDTGHYEAIQVTYDKSKIGYRDLLEVFWRSIDPTDGQGQFADRGDTYRPAIFAANDSQRQAAIASKQLLAETKRFALPIVVPVLDVAKFWPAEEYHQDYYRKNPFSYKSYRKLSGRDQFIASAWGDDLPYQPQWPEVSPSTESAEQWVSKYTRPSDVEIQTSLTDLQFRVTQKDATEPAFKNAYWDNDRDGIYVDVVSGEPLFSSLDKYKSGTGWPSFTQPLLAASIVERTDYYLILPRTEVRSAIGDSHLGHVFNDGPKPNGKRYCINSAALRFVPVNELEAQGYGQFVAKFAS